jgi:hyperosmotically inducible periplasmic protein
MSQHRFRSSVLAFIVTGVVAIPAGSVFAQTPPPDNTKVNTRDRAKGAVTADQQKENAGDRDLAQKIRRSLMADKSLSTYAHNVKVVAQGGQVTLKGPVRTDDEKRNVEAKAVEVAGAGHVTNQMSVAPAHAKRAKK